MAWMVIFVLLQALCFIPPLLGEQVSSRAKISFFTDEKRFLPNGTGTNTTGNKIPGVLAPLGEPEPESEPQAEPEPEEGLSEPEDWPEPGPRWKEAYDEWGVAWELHNYGFSACFFFVFIYALYYVVANIHDGLRKKYLSVSLNMMMVICGFTRFFILALDPYLQGTVMDPPTELMRILWSLTDPCLTAADSLVILSLLETYKLSIAPQRFQRPSTVVPIIIVHFSFVFISDLVVSAFVEAKAMLLFCQLFFIVWCSLLGICYFLIGYKLDQLLFKSGLENEVSQEGRWYIYLIYASGVSNIVTSSVYIYSCAGVFGVYSDVEFVDAWPWWALQTALRITELMAAVLVFTVSAKRAQPSRDPGRSDAKPTGKKRKMNMFSKMSSQREKNYETRIKPETADPNVVPSSDTVPERKRKVSMFTALRDQRNEKYLSSQDKTDLTDSDDGHDRQAFPGIQSDPKIPPTSTRENQSEPVLNLPERKDSMFTVLADKANKANKAAQGTE